MLAKKNISFIHANGFPPNSYKTLLSDLSLKTNIQPFLLRPLDQSKVNTINEIKNWIPFYKDYINSLENKKIIGMGHSIGGNIILRTAISHPNYFSKVILLDPTLFTPKTIFMWKLCSILRLQNKFHPWIKATLNRKMYYKNFNDIFNSYRKKNVFSKINDENLKAYINSITKKLSDNSLKIRYSKEWEHKIYKTGLVADNYIWKNIKNIKVPTLILKAEHSNAFTDSSKQKIEKLNSKKIEIINIMGASHLFPLEYPELVSEKILDFIE